MSPIALLLAAVCRGGRLAACALATSLGMLAALLVLVSAAPRPASAAPLARALGSTIIVTTTIGAALDAAAPGDTLLIPAKTYTESLTLNKAVSLTGVSSATVILQALPGRRVITVTGAIVDSSVVISGLTFRGGQATGDGGGMILTGGAQPRLENLSIVGNKATGAGGGLYSANALVLSGARLLNNNSNSSGGGAYVIGPAVLAGGLFQGNQCLNAICQGGGLWATPALTLTGMAFVSNTSRGRGGGLYADGVTSTVALNGGMFQGNRCTAASCSGGGLWASGSSVLRAIQFINNTSQFSCGGACLPVGTLNGGLFQGNQCTQASCLGGGMASGTFATLSGTVFISNTALGSAGGLWAFGLVLTGGLFQGNRCAQAGCSGGALWADNTAAVTATLFLSNASEGSAGAFWANKLNLTGGIFQNNGCAQAGCSGGALWVDDTSAVTGTRFLSNRAGQGGAIYLAAGDFSLTNALLAGSQAVTGTALYLNSAGSVIVLHTTVASPTLASGTAIHVANGAVGITDTVITSHSLGINLLGGTAYEDYNLFFGVVVPTGGPVTSGPHHPAGDPRFVNPAGGNYHISRSSAALDQGIGVSVTSDFEGDPRPLRSGFDLGFDEYLNRAPVAVADSYATPQNTPLVVGNVQGVLANDADPNLEPLTSTLLSPPAAGLLSLHTDGGFVYTPSLNYSGVVTFTYRASDGELLSAASQVTVTVGPPHHLWLPLVRKP